MKKTRIAETFQFIETQKKKKSTGDIIVEKCWM